MGGLTPDADDGLEPPPRGGTHVHPRRLGPPENRGPGEDEAAPPQIEEPSTEQRAKSGDNG